MRDCIYCGSEFDQNSYRKRKVGGKISECPDCVEFLGTETAPATIGVMSGEGKVGIRYLYLLCNFLSVFVVFSSPLLNFA